MVTERPAGVRRARRHLLVAGFVLAYLAAGGVTLALGDGVVGGGWLALHLVLLGAATNAIVVWSEYFAAALLHTTRTGERAATIRTLALNLGILAVLGGVHGGRPGLAAGGACLIGVVVVGMRWCWRPGWAGLCQAGWGTASGSTSPPSPPWLPGWAWGCGWPAGWPTPPTPTGQCGWPMSTSTCSAGLAWRSSAPSSRCGRPCCVPRMMPGLDRAVRWSLPPLVVGLAVVVAGLLTQRRVVALAGLAGYTVGLALAVGLFVRTALRRPPRTAASWMLGAGMAWFTVVVAGDLVAMAASQRVVDLDDRVARLVPAVAAGFALQTLTGALTYLLPVVFGRGALGNRRLTAILELGWPLRVGAVNLGVLVLLLVPAGGWVTGTAWWLTGLGLGSFVPLAVVALVAATRR
jgi:nitrite reductase (NO-forming)